MRLKTRIFSAVLACASASWLALADVPVVDLSQQPADLPQGTTVDNAGAPIQNNPATSDPQDAAQVDDNTNTVNQTYSQPQVAPAAPSIDTSSLPLNDRVARVEQQQQNLVNMNLPQQISDLQQQVAQLRGQVQEEQHAMQALTQQQQAFYKDLDNRIKQNGAIAAQSKSPVAASPKASAANAAAAAPAAPAAPASVQLKENAAFQAGIDALTKKQYSSALSQFQAYLKAYPNGQFAANATYWLGDIYFTQNNNKQASQQFNNLIKTYPDSAKVPDAQLKLAVIHANSGDVATAKTELQQIIKDHPNSTAAQLANIRLQQLSAKG